MRETCSSGTVRGGDGDVPTYSAVTSPSYGISASFAPVVSMPIVNLSPSCATTTLPMPGWTKVPASGARGEKGRVLSGLAKPGRQAAARYYAYE